MKIALSRIRASISALIMCRVAGRFGAHSCTTSDRRISSSRETFSTPRRAASSSLTNGSYNRMDFSERVLHRRSSSRPTLLAAMMPTVAPCGSQIQSMTGSRSHRPAFVAAMQAQTAFIDISISPNANSATPTASAGAADVTRIPRAANPGGRRCLTDPAEWHITLRPGAASNMASESACVPQPVRMISASVIADSCPPGVISSSRAGVSATSSPSRARWRSEKTLSCISRVISTTVRGFGIRFSFRGSDEGIRVLPAPGICKAACPHDTLGH